MATNSGMFKPSASGSGLGTKKQENGQFINPPTFPESGGFSGSSKAGGKNSMSTQKTPGAKSGKV